MPNPNASAWSEIVHAPTPAGATPFLLNESLSLRADHHQTAKVFPSVSERAAEDPLSRQAAEVHQNARAGSGSNFIFIKRTNISSSTQFGFRSEFVHTILERAKGACRPGEILGPHHNAQTPLREPGLWS